MPNPAPLVQRVRVTRKQALTPAAVRNELARVELALNAQPPMHLRPLLLGARCALRWIVQADAGRPSDTFRLPA